MGGRSGAVQLSIAVSYEVMVYPRASVEMLVMSLIRSSISPPNFQFGVETYRQRGE